LRKSYRIHARLALLNSFAADFICVQEMEYKHIFHTPMALEGWRVVYAKRPGPHADGSGIFYRSERFRVLRSRVVNFNDLVPQDGKMHVAYRKDEEQQQQQARHRLEKPHMEHDDSRHHIHLLDDHPICNETSSSGHHKHDTAHEDYHPDQQGQQQQQQEEEEEEVQQHQQQGKEHHHHHQQHQQHQDEHQDEQPHDMSDPRVRFKRDCVAVMAAFQEVESPGSSISAESVGGSSAEGPSGGGRIVIVVSSHIYWNPKCPDVKLAQAKYLLQEVVRFRSVVESLHHQQCHQMIELVADSQLRGGDLKVDASGAKEDVEGKEEQDQIPVVICGDFNSKPGDPVYSYIVSGSTRDKSRSGDRLATNAAPIPLASLNAVASRERSMCYAAHPGHSSLHDLAEWSTDEDDAKKLEPPFTSLTVDFKETVDYIFVSRDSRGFFVRSTLWIPTDADSHLAGGLPNFSFPSDHFPIGGDVVFFT
ncbi:hypothetical protein CLOM_g17427, partial [Closterium sp. NIES-68]